jgi:hypothetical protein
LHTPPKRVLQQIRGQSRHRLRQRRSKETAIDQSAGTVNLTTVLAHASGEWIASDWPVCAIADTATPRRMGAALTYARRYALFTLVGIAGEDDVDAPDLVTPTQQTSGLENSTGKGPLNGGQLHAPSPAAGRSATKGRLVSDGSALGPEASAELRDQLLGQLKDLAGGDRAALWTHRSLPEKNKLIAADAVRVEEAFQAKLASLTVAAVDEPQTPSDVKQPLIPHPARQTKVRARSKAIDKSVLALPEPGRVRDRDHVRYVAKQPCLVCGRQPSDAHHLRFAQSRAMGRKVSDEFTVPMCRGHHREVHRCGDEVAWWEKAGLDPTVAARALWLETHPMATGPNKLPADVGVTAAARPTDLVSAKRDRRVGGRKASRKPKVDEDTLPHGIA